MSVELSASSDLQGAIDGSDPPGHFTGWVAGRRGADFATDLSIELRCGEAVLARAQPSGPRPDVTGDTATPAAFAIHCGSIVSAK